MATGLSIDVTTGKTTNLEVEPTTVTITILQQDARNRRASEWPIARDGFNNAVDRGLSTQAWQDYRVALRDMTADSVWATDPTAVIDTIIATRPS